MDKKTYEQLKEDLVEEKGEMVEIRGDEARNIRREIRERLKRGKPDIAKHRG